MSSNSKRKMSPTPSPTESNPSKRRLNRRQNLNPVSTTTNATHLRVMETNPQPFVRPKRWRKAGPKVPEPTTEADDNQSGLPGGLPTQPCSDALRFSFCAAADQKPGDCNRHKKSLNRSFSEMVVTAETRSNLPGLELQQRTKTLQRVPAISSVPVLSKPRKKREGYGFSYTDTFMYDSDEYPDTECGWDAEEHTTQPSAGISTRIQQAGEHRQASFGGSTVVDTDCSFDDVVVMRDTGSFHIARPQRILSCTKATREDTMRLKHQAKRLLSKYAESSGILVQLLTRLERMVSSKKQEGSSSQEEIPSVGHCVGRLRDFLMKIKEERIQTGEHRRLVEHEIEWAKWLVEASRTGVMHLKVAGCKCRPDWEEE